MTSVSDIYLLKSGKKIFICHEFDKNMEKYKNDHFGRIKLHTAKFYSNLYLIDNIFILVIKFNYIKNLCKNIILKTICTSFVFNLKLIENYY